jgi:hypothetical protein
MQASFRNALFAAPAWAHRAKGICETLRRRGV